MHKDITRGTHRREDGIEVEGLVYYSLQVALNKMNQLGFDSPSTCPEHSHLLTFCESPCDLILNPTKAFDFYID